MFEGHNIIFKEIKDDKEASDMDMKVISMSVPTEMIPYLDQSEEELLEDIEALGSVMEKSV